MTFQLFLCIILEEIFGDVANIIDDTEIGIGFINPYRYRGYYYDEDTLLYYLQSRYYDPLTGRFINGDATEFLGIDGSVASYNLFAYCGNEPVKKMDLWGYVAFSASSNYFTIKLNDWETSMIIGGITVALEVIGAILAILAAIPSVGISIVVVGAICAVGLAIGAILSFMNLAGNNKGLNINISRKFYLPHYIWINKKEPKGFNDIWEVFNAVKSFTKKIIQVVSVSALKKLVQKYDKFKKSHKTIPESLILIKMIYDRYCGKNVKRQNYV